LFRGERQEISSNIPRGWRGVGLNYFGDFGETLVDSLPQKAHIWGGKGEMTSFGDSAGNKKEEERKNPGAGLTQLRRVPCPEWRKKEKGKKEGGGGGGSSGGGRRRTG